MVAAQRRVLFQTTFTMLPAHSLSPRQVVKELNKRRDPSVPEIPYRELVAKNVRNGTVSDPFSGDNGHCLDAVSSWYACDIEKFGYLSSSRKE